ncbi:hypothetical protein DXV76_15125 [Rhodobacteraceae bacterium CCMM004]|nr:hypothetical protein DXV76_15125 [Rhodobacteraceae bacterium CCMM004]
MTPKVALKLIVPAAFFGYAAVANLALLSAPDVAPLRGAGLMTGAITQELDTLYRENLPHKDPSVGVIGALRYALLDEGRPGVVVGADGVLFTAEETRPVDDDGYGRAVAEVARVAAVLDDAGVGLVVAPVPAKIDLLRAAAPDATAARGLEALHARFVADLTARGIAAVDARPALSALPEPFVATDTHWTPAGAEAVAGAVARSGAVAPGDTVFAVERDAPVSFAGDLVSFVTADWLAPVVGLAPVEIAPYRAVAAADAMGALDLFGGGGGGVDLVGTSYSANPHWGFAEALKLALGRDVINHAEEGRGPVAPMLAYLDGLDPLAPPEAVIWEIPVRYLTDPALVPGGAAD